MPICLFVVPLSPNHNVLYKNMNKLVWTALFVAMIVSPACSRPEPEMPVSFEPRASIPVGRASSVSFSVGGKGYVLGGRTAERSGYLSDVWEYDPMKDTWTELPSAPFAARTNAVAQVVGDKVFVGLGYNGGGVYNPDSYMRDWWMYDAGTGEWERKADYPAVETAGTSAFAVGDEIMVCFGFYALATNDVYAYDVSEDRWRKVDASACGKKEETIAGSVGGRHFAGTCSQWYEYLEKEGRWVGRSTIYNQASRLCASALTDGESLYMIGGRSGWRAIRVYDEVWEYMAAADKWRLRGFLPGGGRENMAAFEIAGAFYVGLGENEDGTVLGDFYKMIIP